MLPSENERTLHEHSIACERLNGLLDAHRHNLLRESPLPVSLTGGVEQRSNTASTFDHRPQLSFGWGSYRDINGLEGNALFTKKGESLLAG